MLSSENKRKVANVGGVTFQLYGYEEVASIIKGWRASRRNQYVVLSNPHSVMLCKRDEDFRKATTSANLILPDGVGITLGARLLGHVQPHRVSGPTLMLQICDRGRETGLRHFFYGGAPGIADQLAHNLREAFPDLQVAGTYCPPFRQLTDSEDTAAVQYINSTSPHVVWVGLGAPKQEKWMADHLGSIRAPAMVGVGAAFDFHSGNVRWAPGWIRRLGLEWAYRLALDPKRMWRRNLDSPLFLACVLQQATSERLANLAARVRPLFEAIDQDTDWGSGGGAAAGSPLLPLATPDAHAA